MLGAELCFGAVDAGGAARLGGSQRGGEPCEVVLPASKSISNRVLLIKALAHGGSGAGGVGGGVVSSVVGGCRGGEESGRGGAGVSAGACGAGVSSDLSDCAGGAFAGLENLAKCDDTDAMIRALASASPATSSSSEHHSCEAQHNGGATFQSERATSAEARTIDIGHAGTAMRFLTAYFAQREGEWILTGSERMKHRPIKILVDALNSLGGDIHYLGEEGYPPLKISGKRLLGGEIEVPASVSSQYISALMMVAPYMERGLSLKLVGSVASKSYIEMTAEIMRTFGVDLKIDGDSILIPRTPYRDTPFKVEADWSAASYIFEALSLADEGKILLPGLYENSLQGDAGQRPIWEKLGVKSSFTERGLLIEKSACEVTTLEEDFTLMPDLVQSFVVACCFKGIGFRFTGVETLRIKETDRIAALVTELAKFGFSLQVEGEGADAGKASGDVNGGNGVADSCNVGVALSWHGEMVDGEASKNIVVESYDDHRMAMAFAPAIIRMGSGLTINDPSVVSKSFPTFWDELSKLGITVTLR